MRAARLSTARRADVTASRGAVPTIVAASMAHPSYRRSRQPRAVRTGRVDLVAGARRAAAPRVPGPLPRRGRAEPQVARPASSRPGLVYTRQGARLGRDLLLAHQHLLRVADPARADRGAARGRPVARRRRSTTRRRRSSRGRRSSTARSGLVLARV
ncbi:MAG: hypothetical protein MZU95_05285 [Desulfomicrobium escambiense]|nr:hypothetical protein [Desulfomicrobium escambiense]